MGEVTLFSVATEQKIKSAANKIHATNDTNQNCEASK
jgi:hypothetical protein